MIAQIKNMLGIYSKKELLNKVLVMSFDPITYGKTKITEEIGKRYPKLKPYEIPYFVSESCSVKEYAHELLSDDAYVQLDSNERKLKWNMAMKERYPWAYDKNLSKLYSDTMYILSR